MTCPSIDVDRQWVKSIKNYVTNRDDLLPPQGRFNAGQKQFYWIMYYGSDRPADFRSDYVVP